MHKHQPNDTQAACTKLLCTTIKRKISPAFTGGGLYVFPSARPFPLRVGCPTFISARTRRVTLQKSLSKYFPSVKIPWFDQPNKYVSKMPWLMLSKSANRFEAGVFDRFRFLPLALSLTQSVVWSCINIVMPVIRCGLYIPFIRSTPPSILDKWHREIRSRRNGSGSAEKSPINTWLRKKSKLYYAYHLFCLCPTRSIVCVRVCVCAVRCEIFQMIIQMKYQQRNEYNISIRACLCTANKKQ